MIENLRKRGIAVEEISPIAMPPPVDGKVLVVNSQLGFVIIDIGETKDLKPAHEMIIYRDEGYVGRVVIEQIYDDLAKAKVRPELQKLPIQEGDDATTRIVIPFP